MNLFGIEDEIGKHDPMSPYRVLITGSRGLSDQKYIDYVLDDLLVDKTHYSYDGFYKFKHDNIVIVHGGANGADKLADNWAKSRARDREIQLSQVISVEVHPADWERYGRGAGHIRNAEMVKSDIDICVAFPHHVDSSKGTLGCMKLADKEGLEVVNALARYWPEYVEKHPDRA